MRRQLAPVLINVMLLAVGSVSPCHGEEAPAVSETTPTLADRDRLGAQADKLAVEGKLIEAIDVARQMLAVEVQIFGANHEEVVGSYGWIAGFLERLGRFPEALDARSKQLEILTALHGADDWRVADARRAIAFSHQKSKLTGDERRELAAADEKQLRLEELFQQGKFADAMSPARECLATRRQVLGAEHPETARSLNVLGFLLDETGDYAAARPYYEQALAINKKNLGEEHPETAVSLNNLGALLQSTGDYAAARPFYEQSLAIKKKVRGEEHPDTAVSLNNLGSLVESMGDYVAAQRYYEQSLAIRKKVLGEEHPATATALNNLGLLLQTTGDYAAARPYFEQALAIQRKVQGDDHPATGTALNNLGRLLHTTGNYAAARPYYEQALAIKKKVLGEEHPDTAALQNNLGLLLKEMGDYTAARSHLEQVLTIRKKVLGDEHPHTAMSLNSLGSVLEATGDYAATRPYYEQALAIRKKVLGEEHPDVATSLNNVGGLLEATGDYAGAQRYYEQALAIHRKVLGEEHPDTAASLNNVGGLLEATGDYAGAHRYYEQALAIHRKVLGEEHPDTASSLCRVGGLLQETSDYAAARPYYEQALAIHKKVHGEEHPDTANSMNSLGLLLLHLGDYAAARPYLEQALAIERKVRGEEHPATATSLNNLGGLLNSMGDSAAARPYYEQALAIRKKVLGEEHPDTALSLNNLGILLHDMGDAAAARPYYEQSLAIRKKVLGEEHPDTAFSLNSLGGLHMSLGDYSAAKRYHKQALAIFRRVQGAEHIHTAKGLDNLAIISTLEKDWPTAIDAFVESYLIQQRSLEKVFATSTEARMRAYLGTMSGDLDALVSLPLTEFDREADGLVWVLRRKAIVFEALCLLRTTQWLAREDPEFAERQSTLVAAQKQLDDVTLRPPAGGAPEELAVKRAALQAQIADVKDQLQSAVSTHLGKDWSLMTTIDSVRSQLPTDAALVELVKYAPYNFQPEVKGSRWGAKRYVAFVLHADAELAVELVDLGEAAAIDEAVAALGQHQKDVQRAGELADWPALEAEYRGLAAPLYEKLFAPIAAKLAGVKRVYLSPDSQLHNLPFEALVDSDGKYLAEQGYTFAYLASGRDLLRGKADQPGEGAFVFAAPNYDLQHGERFQLASQPTAAPPLATARKPAAEPAVLLAAAGPLGTRSADVRGLRWKVLPSMAPEGAKAAEHLADGAYGSVATYSGDAALEEHFKRLVHPRLVVLVTHGFYLPDQPQGRAELLGDDPTTRSAFAQGAGLARLRAQENPLYRSGVVLAGANTLDDPVPDGVSVEDGWLTAAEISQLDLRGTDLVVLSACNTGRGQVATGDAVAGLRSAFLFAGTQTLVGSLYEVPDRETRQLMQSFYAGLRERKGKLESLNAARLELIAQLRKQQGAAHPFFWASFVLVGQP